MFFRQLYYRLTYPRRPWVRSDSFYDGKLLSHLLLNLRVKIIYHAINTHVCEGVITVVNPYAGCLIVFEDEHNMRRIRYINFDHIKKIKLIGDQSSVITLNILKILKNFDVVSYESIRYYVEKLKVKPSADLKRILAYLDSTVGSLG